MYNLRPNISNEWYSLNIRLQCSPLLLVELHSCFALTGWILINVLPRQHFSVIKNHQKPASLLHKVGQKGSIIDRGIPLVKPVYWVEKTESDICPSQLGKQVMFPQSTGLVNVNVQVSAGYYCQLVLLWFSVWFSGVASNWYGLLPREPI